MDDLTKDNQLFIVRAKYDRYTGEKHRNQGEKLFKVVDNEHIIGQMDVEIYDPNTKIEKIIELKLKCVSNVKLPRVWRSAGSVKKTDLPIRVNVVKAYNDDYCWVLLTNLPIKTEEEIKRIVKLYRCRWHIEDFHKILKTGFQAEKVYLNSSRQAIENALTMIAISACRFYWLLYVGRQTKETKATVLFDDYEWKSIFTYFEEPIPINPPSVSEVVNLIARLGGYKNRKNDKPPGIKTFWIGFQFFTVISNTYKRVLEVNQNTS